MGCKKVTPGAYRDLDNFPLGSAKDSCWGYDPYNSADRIERITLQSQDCIEFELGSENDANRALAEGKPRV